MFIKRLKPNIYDVFFGVGWNNWTRVQRHSGEAHVVAGVNLHPRLLNKVMERICK